MKPLVSPAERLAAILARLDAATPGMWGVECPAVVSPADLRWLAGIAEAAWAWLKLPRAMQRDKHGVLVADFTPQQKALEQLREAFADGGENE